MLKHCHDFGEKKAKKEREKNGRKKERNVKRITMIVIFCIE